LLQSAGAQHPAWHCASKHPQRSHSVGAINRPSTLPRLRGRKQRKVSGGTHAVAVVGDLAGHLYVKSSEYRDLCEYSTTKYSGGGHAWGVPSPLRQYPASTGPAAQVRRIPLSKEPCGHKGQQNLGQYEMSALHQRRLRSPSGAASCKAAARNGESWRRYEELCAAVYNKRRIQDREFDLSIGRNASHGQRSNQVDQYIVVGPVNFAAAGSPIAHAAKSPHKIGKVLDIGTGRLVKGSVS